MREATRRIDAIAPVRARSSIYETAFVGDPGDSGDGASQAAFLNAAVLVDWRSTPHALLEALHEIERELGRSRDPHTYVRNGPRTIDLDILLFGDITVEDPPRLVIPHPRLAERAFAIAPLLDVMPGARYAMPRGTSERDVRRISEYL